MRRRLGIAIPLVLTALLSLQATVFGHGLTDGGASKGSFSTDQLVTYKYNGSYPSWVTTAVADSFESRFHNSTRNNSLAPRLQYNAAGTATVHYVAAAASPCSGSTSWIQCASGWGTSSFQIYIRNFGGAPLGSSHWWDTGAGCSGSSCFYLRRGLIHEVGHAILSLDHDDGQSETTSVMRSINPTYAATGGQTVYLQPCDQAATQILWDVRYYSKPYSVCLDHVSGGVAGVGLSSDAGVSGGTSFNQCIGLGMSVSGRLEVKSLAGYGVLADNPIDNRTVWFDRKKSTTSTWTLNAHSAQSSGIVNGNNWVYSFGYPGLGSGNYNYRVHYNGESGLTASDQPTFDILWSTAC